MPPPSPVPGCASGEVWTLSMATRCIAPTILSAGGERGGLWRRSWASSAELRGQRAVDAVDDREELAALIRDVALERPQARHGFLELVVGEGGELGHHAVEALELGCPLGVLLGSQLERQVARR